jgi:hypothetical protein
VSGKTRTGVQITYRFPIAFPGYPGGVKVRGFAPAAVQERIAETGDNAKK